MSGAASSSIADVLERAGGLIEPEGAWIQGSWGGYHCFCAEGAIAHAAGCPATAGHPALEHFAATLPPPPEGKRRIPYWNDAPGRTQAEVVAALRAAAAKAREGAVVAEARL